MCSYINFHYWSKDGNFFLYLYLEIETKKPPRTRKPNTLNCKNENKYTMNWENLYKIMDYANVKRNGIKMYKIHWLVHLFYSWWNMSDYHWYPESSWWPMWILRFLWERMQNVKSYYLKVRSNKKYLLIPHFISRFCHFT